MWIIGEYSDRIENADELLESFLENFHEEPENVQLQLLTAVAKLFLYRPHMEGAQTMVQRVINMSTQESDNPDLRDRGFIYWRLLSSDPAAAKLVSLTLT
jgi:vesicle coat complex subunit